MSTKQVPAILDFRIGHELNLLRFVMRYYFGIMSDWPTARVASGELGAPRDVLTAARQGRGVRRVGKRDQRLLACENGLKRLPVRLLSLLLMLGDFRDHAVAKRGLGQSHE